MSTGRTLQELRGLAPSSLQVFNPPAGFLFSAGTAVPTAAATGFSPGCLYLRTTTGVLYRNSGTKASATWVNIATGSTTTIASGATLTDGGALPATFVFTEQTVGAPTITIPDLASVSDVLVFQLLAQTLTAKTLVAPKILDSDASHSYIITPADLAANRILNLPLMTGTDTMALIAFTQTLTNKSISGATNTITALPSSAVANAVANGQGIPFILRRVLANDAAAVDFVMTGVPANFIVINAWSRATSADGGTWKLYNHSGGAGGADITNAVTVAANADDLDVPTDIIAAAAACTAAGGLSVIPDGAGLLDCVVYALCIAGT